MIAPRWSWFFILNSLLVRLGIATVPHHSHVVSSIHHRGSQSEPAVLLVAATPMSQKNIAGIVLCVIAGVIMAFVGLGCCYTAKRRTSPPPDEESVTSLRPNGGKEGLPVLKSTFSPDEKRVSRGFDRIREAFSRRKKKREDSLLPVHRSHLPRGSIQRPVPAIPKHVHRQPGPLERGHRPLKRSPPPPLKAIPERPELSDTGSSPDSASTTSPCSRKLVRSRMVQPPPRAVLVSIPGRPLPGFSGARTVWLRPPRSPSRRRSWLSKQPFKHPFVPLRTPDISFGFPPRSPLPQYQPSRHHLEARLARSPRRGPLPTPPTPHSARREALPVGKEHDTPTKQTRLVEALHGAVIDGQGTPTGYRHALPPVSSKNLSLSSKFADLPTTAYI